jgi:hypothetical protein
MQEVTEGLSVIERTAQRIIASLKDVLPSISYQTDSERRQRCKLRDQHARHAKTLSPGNCRTRGQHHAG